jgi:PEP-CTERM motif
MRRAIQAGLVVMCSLLVSATAQASIFLVGTVADKGTGFGDVLNILSLQNTGTETGSVSWNGAIDVKTGDVNTGDAKKKSQTLSIATLKSNNFLTAAEFGIVYNVNQQGTDSGLDTQLNSFSVSVYSAAGGLALKTWTYTGPGTCSPPSPTNCFPPIANGTGGAGYLFGFDTDQAAQLQTYWGDGTNRIGMSGSISLANDGQDNFYAYDRRTGTSAVPEPASMLLLGTGLLSAGFFRRRRK